MAKIEHGTLVANTVTAVTLTGVFASVEVTNRDGAAEIFFTVDGAAPTVGGADCECIPATIATLPAPAGLINATPADSGPPAHNRTTTVVRLISSGTPKYTVAGR